MAVRNFHNTLCKIPKIAELIDRAAEDWNEERVYFEVCGTELARIQNFVYFMMVGVSCGQIDRTEQEFEKNGTLPLCF
jgi:hypothetical protein